MATTKPSRQKQLIPRYLFLCFALSLLSSFSSLPPSPLFVSASDELMPLMQRFKKKNANYKPNAIIDIGANVGAWTMAMHELYPSAKFLMIEATPKHEKKLQEVKAIIQQNASLLMLETQSEVPMMIDYRIAVLSNQNNQTVSFYQSGNTGNSMFQEQTQFYKNKVPVQRITETLDTIIENSFLRNERIDIIKCDVQGAEFLVFQGGPKAIQRASLIQFEASVVAYNAGGSCLFEIDEYLRSFGHYLYDLGNVMYNRVLFRTQGAGQYDVLYMRPDSSALTYKIKNSHMQLCGANKEEQDSNDISTHETNITTTTTSCPIQTETTKVSMDCPDCTISDVWVIQIFFTGFTSGIITFWIIFKTISSIRNGRK